MGLDQVAGPYKYLAQHRGSQLARRCILLARVIAPQKGRAAIVRSVFSSVAKPEAAPALNQSALFQQRQVDIESDAAERDHNCHLLQNSQLALQISTAGSYLYVRGLVTGRRAMYWSTNESVIEFEPVVAGRAERLIREASFVEGAIEEFAGAIASEHAPRAISAVCAGREPDYQ